MQHSVQGVYGTASMFQVGLGIADGTRECGFRQIVGKHTTDVVEIGGGDGFLRLDDFHRIGDTGFKPLAVVDVSLSDRFSIVGR